MSEKVKKTIVEDLNITVAGILTASDICKKDGQYYGVRQYTRILKDDSVENYLKFNSLKEGKPLEIAVEDYRANGLKGSLSSTCGQGLYNDSKVLDFGVEFELDLQKVKGKVSVGNVRRSGQIKMKSSVSESEVEAALGNISVESIKE